MKKRSRGRPLKGDEVRRQRLVRASDQEWERIRAAAEAEGITRAEFVRSAALRAAERVLKKRRS